MRRRLIVNADDYGLTEGVSRGIREAHLRGIVSSSSVMMNMPGVEKELKKAGQQTPNLGLGVHLNLTAGYPVLHCGEIRSLVDEDGRFLSHKDLIQHLEEINFDEVMGEWEEQVRNFIEYTGRMPTHLDSHHHCSFYSPGLFQIMLTMAKKYQCAIRSIFTEFPFTLAEDFPASSVDEFTSWSTSVLSGYTIPQPDHFSSSFFGDSATMENLMTLLRKIPDGVSELMCHPGYADGSLAQISSLASNRERELEILTHPDITNLVKIEFVQIVSFNDIQLIKRG